MTTSKSKTSPELNKGAAWFSTTVSSCHLPYEEALLAAYRRPACQFYLQHFVTSDRRGFMKAPTLVEITLTMQCDKDIWLYYSNLTFHILELWLTSNWPLMCCQLKCTVGQTSYRKKKNFIYSTKIGHVTSLLKNKQPPREQCVWVYMKYIDREKEKSLNWPKQSCLFRTKCHISKLN